MTPSSEMDRAIQALGAADEALRLAVHGNVANLRRATIECTVAQRRLEDWARAQGLDIPMRPVKEKVVELCRQELDRWRCGG